jgi:hypothetical protein
MEFTQNSVLLLEATSCVRWNHRSKDRSLRHKDIPQYQNSTPYAHSESKRHIIGGDGLVSFHSFTTSAVGLGGCPYRGIGGLPQMGSGAGPGPLMGGGAGLPPTGPFRCMKPGAPPMGGGPPMRICCGGGGGGGIGPAGGPLKMGAGGDGGERLRDD